jgi:hypothetical protein
MTRRFLTWASATVLLTAGALGACGDDEETTSTTTRTTTTGAGAASGSATSGSGAATASSTGAGAQGGGGSGEGGDMGAEAFCDLYEDGCPYGAPYYADRDACLAAWNDPAATVACQACWAEHAQNAIDKKDLSHCEHACGVGFCDECGAFCAE